MIYVNVGICYKWFVKYVDNAFNSLGPGRRGSNFKV